MKWIALVLAATLMIAFAEYSQAVIKSDTSLISVSLDSIHAILFSGQTSEKEIVFQEGCIFTTDAVFRETKDLVQNYQKKEVLGVEMELSALFTIGNFRGVPISAILVVSDELSTLQWKPGFGAERFKKQCKVVQGMITKICLKK